MDTRIGHQVSLELGEIHIESAVESQRSGDGGDNLTDEPVEVGVGGTLDVEVPTADVVDGLVVDHESAVRVLQGGVGGEDGVVGLDDSGRDLRSGVDGEFELGLFAVIHGETLHQEGGESGAGTTAERVEEEETLETGALIGELTDAVEDEVDDFLANGVVASGVVVGSIFLAGDELFGVEQLPVGASAGLICSEK